MKITVWEYEICRCGKGRCSVRTWTDGHAGYAGGVLVGGVVGRKRKRKRKSHLARHNCRK